MRSRRIQLKLTADLLSKIDAVAKVNFETRSAFIRKSVALRLNSQQIVEARKDQTDWEKIINQAKLPPNSTV